MNKVLHAAQLETIAIISHACAVEIEPLLLSSMLVHLRSVDRQTDRQEACCLCTCSMQRCRTPHLSHSFKEYTPTAHATS